MEMYRNMTKKIINLTEEGEALGYPKTPDSEMIEMGIFDGKIINFIKVMFIKIVKMMKR